MTSEVGGEPKTQDVLETRLKNVSRRGHHQLFEGLLGCSMRCGQGHEYWILEQGGR